MKYLFLLLVISVLKCSYSSPIGDSPTLEKSTFETTSGTYTYSSSSDDDHSSTVSQPTSSRSVSDVDDDHSSTVSQPTSSRSVSDDDDDDVDDDHSSTVSQPTSSRSVSDDDDDDDDDSSTTTKPMTTSSTYTDELTCPDTPPNELLFRCTSLQWRLHCLPSRSVCYGQNMFGHCYGTEMSIPARWVCSGSKVNGNCLQANDYWNTFGRCDLVRVRGQVGRPCDIFDLVDGVGKRTGCFSDVNNVWSSTECGGQHNLRGQWTYNQERDTYSCASKFDSTVNGKCCLVFPLENW